MIPSLGRIVHYRLSEEDATAVNRRRHDARMHLPEHRDGATGVQIHVGNPVSAGEVYAAVIVTQWGGESPTPNTSVNLKVLLDGTDDLWVTSASQGVGQRQWSEPPRVGAPVGESGPEKFTPSGGGSVLPADALADEGLDRR